MEIIAEKVDSVLNLHATNSVLDSEERVMYACSGYGRYNYISRLSLSLIPDVISEIDLENFASPTYIYSDAKILVVSNLTATAVFTLGENIAVNKSLKIERNASTILMGKMGTCLYQVLSTGIQFFTDKGKPANKIEYNVAKVSCLDNFFTVLNDSGEIHLFKIK